MTFMPDLETIQKKIQELSDNYDNLNFSFWKKTGPSTNGISNTDLESTNFVTGSSGWRLDADGNLEANAGTFRGALQANSIDIPDTTTANSFHTDNQGNSWWGATTFGAAPASISKAGAANFSSLTISGYAQSTAGTFGGDGTDGALTLTNSTTTLSFGSTTFLVKNYSTISITGTGKLAFSNPATQGSAAIIKANGNITLTASAPIVDISAMGGAGGAAVGPTSATTAGNAGTNGSVAVFQSNAATGNTGGSGTINSVLYPSTFSQHMNRYPLALVGSGAGSGSVFGDGSHNATSGAGGRGGGCLIIECAGAWNFTTASGISIAGGAGADGTSTNAGSNSAGGGGGSGGFLLVLYKTLTANSGTVVTSGGVGGNSAGNANNVNGGGGGGFLTAGTTGSSFGGAGKDGGDGAVGLSTIAANAVFT